eukprot:c23347_g1_i1 orf=1301-1468(+)
MWLRNAVDILLFFPQLLLSTLLCTISPLNCFFDVCIMMIHCCSFYLHFRSMSMAM